MELLIYATAIRTGVHTGCCVRVSPETLSVAVLGVITLVTRRNTLSLVRILVV